MALAAGHGLGYWMVWLVLGEWRAKALSFGSRCGSPRLARPGFGRLGGLGGAWRQQPRPKRNAQAAQSAA